VNPGHIIFRVHALTRMFERRISVEDVRTAITRGEVVQTYPDDKPYPSRLLLGWIGTRPLHVVVAEDSEDGILIVVTAYEPDPIQWDSGFKRKVL
jgi:beta-phosphoglucomutase-like phosphatase (HAD superfamily)